MTATTISSRGTEPSDLSRADMPASFSVTDFPVPSGKEEEWRFTPMCRIQPLLGVDRTHFSPVDVQVEGPQGALIQKVGRDDRRIGTVLAPTDRLSALAWENFTEATVVTILKDTELVQPVYLKMKAPQTHSVAHICVKAEENSSGTVIILHEGPALLTETVEVRADNNSHLNVISVHQWTSDALHASSHRVSVGRDATLKHTVVTLGGDLVRVKTESEFTAPGGQLYMNGVYFVDRGQHYEHRPFVHHNQPNCYSRSTYKGALQGDDAHTVWVGDCLIGKNGDDTDTYELNRNLILTEGAKVDSVPNLEIENGEIEGAGHASATGRFDDDQLFYLMSRGVSPLEAKRLVTRGFFAEVIDQIGVKNLQDHLMEQIETELCNYDLR